MKTRLLLSVFFILTAFVSKAQNATLAKEKVQQDLDCLKKILNDKSSYAYLNGYDFNSDFENYLKITLYPVRIEDFGLFLATALGKIGDRHSSVRDYESRDSLFLPFIFAPEHKKVVVLNRNAGKELQLLNPKFPYLKNINGIAIEEFLQKILPAEIKAPSEAYFTRAVRELRDIQKIYKVLNKKLPAEIRLTLSDSAFQKDMLLAVSPVEKSKRSMYWDEKFEKQYFQLKEEDYNKAEIIGQLFTIQDQIAYIQIPAMVSREEAPLLFEKLNSFMESIKDNSKALIVDVRSNGGGTRDLTYELAKYFVHPDSIYVVNATRQRGPIPLPEDYKESLHSRNLLSFSELDAREQQKTAQFLKTFKPMYELDSKKYSEYYFGLFSGKKLQGKSFFYSKPVYILANEKSFSAASVFVAVFKGIPNIHIAGGTTDGSSGNSERFELPNSKLRIKISTMVSFQKDGKILDGVGTAPDIKIERDLDQIFWKSDTQLEKLRGMILNKN